MSVPSTIQAQKDGFVKPLDPQENAFRLEIDEFVQNRPLLNVFLLALEALQDNKVLKPGPNATEEDWEKYWWSFYSIAGIHGWPKGENWSHKHKGPARDARTGYYCQHGEPLFPTWHRPYVMMMEQAVFNKMYAIANRFSDREGKAGYLEAVKRFRLPYWDPWMPRRMADPTKDWNGLFGVPAILRAQEVFVRRPGKGQQSETIENPLYRYQIPNEKDVRSEARINWNVFGQMPDVRDQITIRTPGGAKTSRNNDIILDYELRSQVVEEQSKLLQMLVNLSDTKQGWDTFSNHTAGQAPSEVSLESWHDNFHVLVGNGRGQVQGNMMFTAVAAFDPIFWLHHCNIDRILALYQALHPGRYVSAQELKTPLKPFFNIESGDLWTSEDARDWKQCGFAVPGTHDMDLKTSRKIVGDYINRNYKWMSNKEAPPADLGFPKSMDRVEALIGQGGRNPPPDFTIQAVKAGTPRLMTRTISLAKGANTVTESPAISAQEIMSRDKTAFPKGALDGDKQRTWNIHLKVRKFAFNGSFSVNAFLGQVNDNSSEAYMLLDNQIGFSGIFTSGAEAECQNCNKQRRMDTRYADVIPLTNMLVGCLETNDWAGGPPEHLRSLASLEPSDVVPFLTKRLEWRITTADGSPKTQQEVIDSGLEIMVMDRWYNLPTPDEPLGSYEDATLHEIITHGKAGGYTE